MNIKKYEIALISKNDIKSIVTEAADKVYENSRLYLEDKALVKIVTNIRRCFEEILTETTYSILKRISVKDKKQEVNKMYLDKNTLKQITREYIENSADKAIKKVFDKGGLDLKDEVSNKIAAEILEESKEIVVEVLSTILDVISYEDEE